MTEKKREMGGRERERARERERERERERVSLRRRPVSPLPRGPVRMAPGSADSPRSIGISRPCDDEDSPGRGAARRPVSCPPRGSVASAGRPGALSIPPAASTDDITGLVSEAGPESSPRSRLRRTAHFREPSESLARPLSQ